MQPAALQHGGGRVSATDGETARRLGLGLGGGGPLVHRGGALHVGIKLTNNP
jgi:hypothetical protein